ncbi:MAG: thiol-disulfide isomerase [Bryobacteraceae bacterium]
MFSQKRHLLFLVGIALKAEVVFSTNVWPILERHCVACHQPGEIAPMPLTSYSQVRPWANAIRQAVLTRKMPPWDAAGETAHDFRNDRSLTETEIQTITTWVKEGAPEGAPLKTAFHPASVEGGWKLGKPDIVIRVPGFHVPASGLLTYRYLITPGLFPKDVWVRAAEFRIDQRSVVHHINAYARGPESSYLEGYPKGQIVTATVADRGRRREGERVFDRRLQLIGWEPGYQPMPWLPDGAKQIRAGSDIVFEMHYSPNGKEVTDYSELGIYLANAPPTERVMAIDTLRDLDLAIPAGDPDYVSRASMTLAQPVTLVSVQPHMHRRGKSMEVRAIYPDGRTRLLVSVPRYDFNWQTTYVLREPLLLPAGTRLESIAHFDNSANNPTNPDPSVPVHWGDMTTDEMHIAFLELAMPVEADPEKLFAAPPRMIGAPPGKK